MLREWYSKTADNLSQMFIDNTVFYCPKSAAHCGFFHKVFIRHQYYKYKRGKLIVHRNMTIEKGLRSVLSYSYKISFLYWPELS